MCIVTRGKTPTKDGVDYQISILKLFNVTYLLHYLIVKSTACSLGNALRTWYY